MDKKLRFPKYLLLLIACCFLLPVSMQAQGSRKLKTIIIDPGHGGKDVGARGEYENTLGSFEKDITLAISLKLVAELKKQMPDVNIIPTRTTDVYHSVREKAQFANDHKGDLFVSIHADAVVLKKGSRIVGYKNQTYWKNKKKYTRKVPIREYYKIPTSRKGTSTLILAAHKSDAKVKALEESDLGFLTEENDSSLHLNYESPEWKASALLYSTNYFKRSYTVASAIQQEIAKSGRNDLGVWQRQTGLWVLQATQMPAILIETGFIANYDDERYLNSEKGQQEIAEVIARGIVRYRDVLEGRDTAVVEKATEKAP